MAETAEARAVNGGTRSTIALAATVIGVVGGLNALVTSCTTENQTSAAAYRTSIDREVAFWSGLIDDIQDIKNSVPGKLDAIVARRLANIENSALIREVDEASFQGAVNFSANDVRNIEAMRDSVLSQFSDQFGGLRGNATTLSSNFDRQTIAEHGFGFANDWQRHHRRNGNAALIASGRIALAHQYTIPLLPSILQLNAPDIGSVGWDFDIFWCHDGYGEEPDGGAAIYRANARNFVAAVRIARRALSDSSDVRDDQLLVGRVRVRLLPERQRTDWGVPPGLSYWTTEGPLLPGEQRKRNLAEIGSRLRSIVLSAPNVGRVSSGTRPQNTLRRISLPRRQWPTRLYGFVFACESAARIQPTVSIAASGQQLAPNQPRPGDTPVSTSIDPKPGDIAVPERAESGFVE
jgi:hypothetical protein